MLDYDQHTTLLISAETGYDSQFTHMSSIITRKVYNTKLGGSNFELYSLSEFAEDSDYDVYASATILLANMTNRGNSNSDSFLPLEDYSYLTQEEKYL